jgi:hypothetical protein
MALLCDVADKRQGPAVIRATAKEHAGAVAQ